MEIKTTMTIKVSDGKEITIDVEEAKVLYQALKNMLGENSNIVYTTYQSPPTNPYPQVGYPPYIVTSDTRV